MAKLRKRRVHWNAPATPGVVGYRLYWSVGGGVGYHSDFADVGNVTQVVLPDGVPSFPLIKGEVELGITAVNEIGNESDMTRFSAIFNFVAPDAPSNLVVETLSEYHVLTTEEEDPRGNAGPFSFS